MNLEFKNTEVHVDHENTIPYLVSVLMGTEPQKTLASNPPIYFLINKILKEITRVYVILMKISKLGTRTTF